jgi:hypothetical protein
MILLNFWLFRQQIALLWQTNLEKYFLLIFERHVIKYKKISYYFEKPFVGEHKYTTEIMHCP